MSEMKISPTDDCIWFNEDFTLMIDGETPKEAEIAAGKINSHDRMMEEIKELRDFVRMVADADSASDEVKSFMVHSFVHNAKQLLAKLNQEGEE